MKWKTEFSDAVSAKYLLADAGAMFEPVGTTVMVIAALAAVMFAATWVGRPGNGRSPFLGLCACTAFAVVVSMSLIDLRNARLASVTAVPVGTLQSIAVSGGGCTPIRSNFALENGHGATVDGTLEGGRLGVQVYTKTISRKGKPVTYYCTDALSPKACSLQSE